MSSEDYQRGPISFEIAKWLGYMFATMYILYGGVQIILGVLDRNYGGFAQWLIFLLLGVVLLVVAFAYRDLKKWGWTGMLVLAMLMVLGSAVQLRSFSLEGLLLLLLGLLLAGSLLAPTTRDYLQGDG